MHVQSLEVSVEVSSVWILGYWRWGVKKEINDQSLLGLPYDGPCRPCSGDWTSSGEEGLIAQGRAVSKCMVQKDQKDCTLLLPSFLIFLKCPLLCQFILFHLPLHAGVHQSPVLSSSGLPPQPHLTHIQDFKDYLYIHYSNYVCGPNLHVLLLGICLLDVPVAHQMGAWSSSYFPWKTWSSILCISEYGRTILLAFKPKT